jgi:hypothetical protein
MIVTPPALFTLTFAWITFCYSFIFDSFLPFVLRVDLMTSILLYISQSKLNFSANVKFRHLICIMVNENLDVFQSSYPCVCVCVCILYLQRFSSSLFFYSLWINQVCFADFSSIILESTSSVSVVFW